MIISLNSAITTGIFNIFEILFSFLFVHAMFLSCRFRNLHTLYYRRQPLRLHSTRLSILSSPFLTIPSFSRLYAILFLLFTALLSFASFAFVGQSQPEIVTKTVPLLVTAAKHDFLDYRRHLSRDGRTASATFILINRANCIVYGNNKMIYFEAFNDLPGDINEVKWSVARIGFRNSTCVMSRFGFVPKRSAKWSTQTNPLITSAFPCKFPFNFTDLPPNFFGSVDITPYASEMSPQCPGRLDSFHCSNHNVQVCIVSLEISKHFVFLAFHSKVRGYIYGPEPQTDRISSEALSSMVYIMDTGFMSASFSSAWRMATHTVVRDGQVQKQIGQKEVTDVNLNLFLGAAGSAIAICLIVLSNALQGWWTIGYKRRHYNGFCGIDDAKASLLFEMNKRKEVQCSGSIWRPDGHLSFCQE